jgi:protein-disulfide isomerase
MANQKARTGTAPVASAKKSAKDRRAEAERRRRQQQTILLTVIGLVALGVVALVVLVTTRPITAEIASEVTQRIEQDYGSLPAEYFSQTPEGYFAIGNPDAPVTMEEFSSFSCPACRSYHESYFKPLMDKIQAGELRFVYIPLTNFGSWDSSNMARAAVCAGVQGKFWEMHDVLFDWQGRLGSQSNEPRLHSSASELLGLDRSQFDACYDSRSTTDVLTAAADLRAARGVNSTPTVYLDGEKVYPQMADGSNGPSPAQIRGIIESKVAAEG